MRLLNNNHIFSEAPTSRYNNNNKETNYTEQLEKLWLTDQT